MRRTRAGSAQAARALGLAARSCRYGAYCLASQRVSEQAQGIPAMQRLAYQYCPRPPMRGRSSDLIAWIPSTSSGFKGGSHSACVRECVCST